jgi:hypothetical protein
MHEYNRKTAVLDLLGLQIIEQLDREYYVTFIFSKGLRKLYQK